MFPWNHFEDGTQPESIIVMPGDMVARTVIFPFSDTRLKEVMLDRPVDALQHVEIAAKFEISLVDSSGRHKERNLTGVTFMVGPDPSSGLGYPQEVVRLLP